MADLDLDPEIAALLSNTAKDSGDTIHAGQADRITGKENRKTERTEKSLSAKDVS